MQNKNECPTLLLTHVLGKRWTIPILEEVYFSKGSAQFNNIKRAISTITPKRLNASLLELCEADLLKKHTFRYNNVRYTKYSLTDKGDGVEQLVRGMKNLGVCWYGMRRDCAERKCGDCPVFTGKVK